MKKGQVTVFAIITIVILLTIYLIFLATNEDVTNKLDPNKVIQYNLFPVSNYIDYCVEKELTPIVQELASNGGTLNLSNKDTIKYHNKTFLKLFKEENYILTNEKVTKEIEPILLNNLNNCINLSEYEKEGFNITEGNKQLKINIQDNQIVTNLNFPITLSNENKIIEEDTFQSITEIPLGKIIKDANDIINTELKNNFDLDYYRLTNDIEIEKNSIYPTEIYKLTSGKKHLTNYIEFNFAIENIDLTTLKYTNPEYLFEKPKQENQGTCEINDMCLEYVTESNCIQNNGSFSITKTCQKENRELNEFNLNELLNQPEIIKQLDVNNESNLICTNWTNINTGEIEKGIRFNGESWCSNEVGVGGQNFKLSCVKGKVITEPCTDFKEDICAENTYQLNTNLFEGQFTTAVCRPNRFQDCTECTSESCCNNDNLRDCSWNDNVCIPITPPGIKFWNLELASSICSNSIKDETSCYSQGDCNTKINFAGELSGYNKELIEKLVSSRDPTKEIPRISNYFIRNSKQNIDGDEFIQNLNVYLKNIDETLVYDLEEYLNPETNIDLESINTKCSPWVPPTTNNCNLCNDNTCTEYKCKSLGTSCQFEIKKGYPNCFLPNTPLTKLEITSVEVNNKTISLDNSILGNGIIINEPIKLNELLNIKIETNNEALCKLNYLPKKSFSEINSKDLTNQEYSLTHNVSLRINHDYNLYDRFLNYFNLNDAVALLNKLTDLRYQFEALKVLFPDQNKYSTGLYKTIVPIVDYYLDSSTEQQLKLILNDLEQGKQNIFIKCMDKSTTESEDYHIKLETENECFDNDPPKILKTIPEDGEEITNTIQIYVNEISECKFDIFDVNYLDMRYKFDCESNPYVVSGVNDGSYECKTKVPKELLNEKNTFYIRCNDLPDYRYKNDLLNLSLSQNGLNDNYNLTISNYSNTIKIDLEEFVKEKKVGTFNLNLPAINAEYYELVFNKPFTCTESKCSNTRCITKETNIQCKVNIPECRTQNKATESLELNLFKRDLLNFTEINYENKIFKVDLNTVNQETSCGIELDESKGYERMNKINQTFIYETNNNEIGVHQAIILCVNNQDSIKKEVTYSII